MAIMLLNNIDAVINKLEQLQVKSGVVEDLKQLETTSNRIAAIVEDAEQMEIHDKSTKLWLAELTEVFNDAQDVVDELEYEIVKAQVEEQLLLDDDDDDDEDEFITYRCIPLNDVTYYGDDDDGGGGDGDGDDNDVPVVDELDYHQQSPDCNYDLIRVHESWRYTNLSLFIADIIADRVKKINKKLEDICKFRLNFQLTSEDGTRRPDCRPKYPLPTSHMLNTSHEVYGREKDKKKIVDWLISGSRSDKFGVVSIVGKGGIGKTTVAQLVYNDDEVSAFFDLKIWICVSLDFDVVKLTREMVQAVLLPKESCNSSQLCSLLNVLQPKLAGKKILLVLDDVWTLQKSLWKSFKNPLDDGKQSVRIVVTTRNEEISSIINSTKMYRLDYLHDSECWELFKSQAFRSQTSGQFAHLEDIGRKIVRKSGGLPLVVKSLGGILQYSTDDEQWNDVLESKLWDLEGEDEILPILQLSYNYLPIYLKPCFLSCTVFPKDYTLKKVEVVHLWIALGYIQSKSQSLEDTGNHFFDELQKRSFFDRDNRYHIYDNQEIFKMHDCIHDLAQYISNKNCGASSKLKALVCSYSSKNDLSAHLMSNIKHLRFVVLNKWPKDLHNLYNLRVLVVNARIIKLPNQIANLINLIYLRVHLKTLTKSTCQLYNLVTLDLSNSSQFKKLFLPTGFGKLSKLERLYLHAGANTNGISELSNLINLRGTLCIENITNINVEGAKKANLKNKPKIDDLRFYWYDSGRFCNVYYNHLHLEVCANCHHSMGKNRTKKKVEDVLQSLQPHTNLRSLIIEGYGGAKFPRWLGDPSFTRLNKIHLFGCKKASCLPTLGQLPLLQHLWIGGFLNVESIGSEFLRNLPCDSDLSEDEKVAFPSLLKLEFYRMHRWEEWHGLQDHDFPLLQELDVTDCSLVTLPGLLLKNLIRFRSRTGMHIQTVGEIKFLKNLVVLGSVLYISRLRNIVNAEDAKEANMKIKDGLDILTLDYGPKDILYTEEERYGRMFGMDTIRLSFEVCSHDGNYISVDEVDNIQAAVLESLQPHTNLRVLRIYSYGGVSFPHWLGHPSFTKLTQLTISECDNVITLPKLGQLPCLESLRIQKILHIKNIGPEFCRLGTGMNDGDVAFPSLKSLVFHDMAELEEWTGVLHGDFPQLEILIIINCPTLSTTPTVPSSVSALRLRECRSLQSLHLAPDNVCPSNLKIATLQNCTKLQVLTGMHNIDQRIVHFNVDNCPLLQFRFCTQTNILGEEHS